eukprot:12574830-Ditylum_brightwellii.AAC.1
MLKDTTISDSEPEEETEDTTPRHPETIIAMPVAPGSKKMKTGLQRHGGINKRKGESVGHRQWHFNVKGQSDNQQHVPTFVHNKAQILSEFQFIARRWGTYLPNHLGDGRLAPA